MPTSPLVLTEVKAERDRKFIKEEQNKKAELLNEIFSGGDDATIPELKQDHSKHQSTVLTLDAPETSALYSNFTLGDYSTEEEDEDDSEDDEKQDEVKDEEEGKKESIIDDEGSSETESEMDLEKMFKSYDAMKKKSSRKRKRVVGSRRGNQPGQKKKKLSKLDALLEGSDSDDDEDEDFEVRQIASKQTQTNKYQQKLLSLYRKNNLTDEERQKKEQEEEEARKMEHQHLEEEAERRKNDKKKAAEKKARKEKPESKDDEELSDFDIETEEEEEEQEEEEEEEAEQIQVRIERPPEKRKKGKTHTTVKMDVDAPFRLVIESLKEKWKQSHMILSFDGEAIQPDQTPQQIGLENGDQIDAQFPQGQTFGELFQNPVEVD